MPSAGCLQNTNILIPFSRLRLAYLCLSDKPLWFPSKLLGHITQKRNVTGKIGKFHSIQQPKLCGLCCFSLRTFPKCILRTQSYFQLFFYSPCADPLPSWWSKKNATARKFNKICQVLLCQSQKNVCLWTFSIYGYMLFSYNLGWYDGLHKEPHNQAPWKYEYVYGATFPGYSFTSAEKLCVWMDGWTH